jgi:hypothetical protein
MDFLHKPFTLAGGREVPLNIFIPCRFFHFLKPASELPAFLFRQVLDRFHNGFQRRMFKLAYARYVVESANFSPYGTTRETKRFRFGDLGRLMESLVLARRQLPA